MHTTAKHFSHRPRRQIPLQHKRLPGPKRKHLYVLQSFREFLPKTPESCQIVLIHHQDDLINLDIAAGQCRNTTIPQNITFSTQGLPFGLSKKSAANYFAPSISWAFVTSLAMLVWGLGMDF